MSDRLFVRLFVYLALIFVPVVVVYGPTRLITPCCYILYAYLFERAHHYQTWMGMIGELLPVVFYGVVFYGLARLASRFLDRAPGSRQRIALQVAVLATLFACSFLPVIGRDTSWAPSGTYTFWGACARYQQKYFPRDHYN